MIALLLLSLAAGSMSDSISWPFLNSLGVVGLWSFIGFMVLTRKLVWHKDLTEVKNDRDEWKGMALRGLGVAEKSTAHAELLIQQVTPEAPAS